jgi:hypothetical protein
MDGVIGYFAVWPSGSLLKLPASLLAIAFTGQCLLDAEFLAWLQIEGVPLDFPMMFSCTTFRLNRRSAFSTVSPSWSLTSAKRHLRPAPIVPVASWGLFRLRSRFTLSQLLHQFLAGLEARTPF